MRAGNRRSDEGSFGAWTGISRIGISKRVDLGTAEEWIESGNPEKPISVYYDGQLVGAFMADVLVNNSLIIELKAIQAVAKTHEVQLVNYFVATGIDEGLLLNFGAERLEFKKKFRVPKSEPVSF